MYYNIKIKANDSEFSLESENKGIIEREMDAYFAYFFDASFEFKSKIKKVELTNDSLVSIDEFKTPDVPPVENHQEEIINDEIEEEVQYYESSDDFDEEEEVIEQLPETIETIDEEPQVIEEVSFKNEPVVPDIIIDEEEEETLEPDIIIEQEEQEPLYEPTPEPTQEQAFEPTPEPTPEPVQEVTKPPIKLDFKLFLAGFIISDIFNQFIACAYYIKNVLKENCFNMKTINSYLIKATGNIADMSIVSELMQKEYIDSKEINDATVYYITHLGEEYFIKKYQE